MKRQIGWTLLEILIVTAIIALLASLMFPLLRSAKAKAKESVCTSNLRQVGIAYFLYREDSGGFPPTRSVDPIIDYIKGRGTEMCPQDSFQGFGSRGLGCVTSAPVHRTSYFSAFPASGLMWDRLQRINESHGILACRNHGERTDKHTLASTSFCSVWAMAYEGKVVRFNLDGSVTHGNNMLDPDATVPNSSATFRYWRLFVNATDKEWEQAGMP